MKNKRDSGVLVVEASIIVTLVVLFITIMLYICMVLYQQTLVSVMANRTASDIAQVYSNNLKDPFTGYIDPNKVYQTVTYTNMKTDAFISVIEQKANVFAKYRLKSSRILAEETSSVDVQIVKKTNELLKNQIVVTIRSKYDMPIVGFFGASGLVEFASSGRADCVDYLDYLQGVAAIGDPENDNIVPVIPDTCIVAFVTDKYSVGFHANVPVLSGKSIITSNHYTHSAMPADPRLNGMKFIGWFLDDGTPFVASKQIDEDMTVYGKWHCKVTFNADGGSVNPTEKYVEYMKTTDLPTPSRWGYAFDGWYTQKNGGGTKYVSNSTIFKGNITLYAKWLCIHPTSYEASRDGNVCTGGTIYYKCTQCHCDLGTGHYGGIGHASYEAARIGNVCEGGTIYYKCIRCQCDLGTGHYGGGGHLYRARCDVLHIMRPYFCGCVSGGCGQYHGGARSRCGRCGGSHASSGETPRAYCILCVYCHNRRDGAQWCGMPHAGNSAKPAFAPVNGHGL